MNEKVLNYNIKWLTEILLGQNIHKSKIYIHIYLLVFLNIIFLNFFFKFYF